MKQHHADETPYDARVVANFILHYHSLRAEPVTQLRLYKLLYFSHGWHLVERHEPLVWNYFEAWENGPVIKVVRDNFASFKEKPIDGFCSMFDFRKGETVELPHRLRTPEEDFISWVIEAYRRPYSSEQFDSFAAKYAQAVALLADAGLGLHKPNFRGYRIWDPDQPTFSGT